MKTVKLSAQHITQLGELIRPKTPRQQWVRAISALINLGVIVVLYYYLI